MEKNRCGGCLNFPVIDFHADLLSYMALDEKFTENDSESNCSIIQLEQGFVKYQVLPIFTQTKTGSSICGLKQLSLFEKIKEKQLATQFILAVENASSLIEENEPIDLLFKRIDSIKTPIIYLSLTWSQENRFGGGNETDIGLKDEGKLLLDYLDKKNICIDLSHTSDKLAFHIIDYIEQRNMKITPIASHSNCRKVCNRQRNLPDSCIEYIIKKEGIIGINFVAFFIGSSSNDFLKHIEHLEQLHGQNNTTLGADFFSAKVLGSLASIIDPLLPIYFKEFNNSSMYPRFIEFLSAHLPLPMVEKIAYLNGLNFLNNKLKLHFLK